MAGAVKPAKEGALLNCRVTPSASRNEITGITGDAVRIKVTSPPIEGRANKAVIALLGKTFKIPKSRIVILKGDTGKLKKILLGGAKSGDVMEKIKTMSRSG